MQNEPRALGRTLSDMELSTAVAVLGLVVVVVGSIGPWVTSPLSSTDGLDGDGKWVVVSAVFATVAMIRGRRLGAAWCATIILALGIYDAVHIQHVAARDTLFGQQAAHVGWGVYAVIAGAALTLIGLWAGRSQDPGEMLRDWTRKQV